MIMKLGYVVGTIEKMVESSLWWITIVIQNRCYETESGFQMNELQQLSGNCDSGYSQLFGHLRLLPYIILQNLFFWRVKFPQSFT